MFRRYLLCTTLVVLAVAAASAQAVPSAHKDSAKTQSAAATPATKVEPANKGGALYFSKDQVDQIFAASGSFIKDKEGKYQISAGRRETPGTAEIHGKDTDIFYVLDGTATIVTGGTLVDEKTTAPDEIRGSSIKDGSATKLSKGELIVIPHGTPHWIKEVQGTFQYLVVKVR